MSATETKPEAEAPEEEPFEEPTPAEPTPEEQEEGDTPEPEPEPEPEPAPPTPEQIEKVEKALDKERTAHIKKLASILGDTAIEVLPCPLCAHDLQGLIRPGVGVHLPDENKEAARSFIGGDGASEYREAEGVEMCERCDGLGQLAYPTKVPHVETQPCPRCNGKGYVSVGQNAPAAPTPAAAPPLAVARVNGGVTCEKCGAPLDAPGAAHWCNPAGA